ncbi:hypothetical protein Nepgr_000340 [Nepenthes gracilis]|uniref:Core Histone H2A/H2B/H3 domain-containing protein n=1 Tax=Nepenthes gracilis TaxID=150966 RepID=A0AAD3P312_NEPGR|nr:hypothetical protein Nepgr_000340 [Nepenthes gracilis]
MAPNRAANKVVSSVVTRTGRVVEVSVIGDEGKEAKFIEEVDQETEEEETVDIIEKPVKSIPVEDLQSHKQQPEELQKQQEDDDEETQEAQRPTEERKIDQITTSPRNQEGPPKQQKEEREETRAGEKPDEARGVEGERKRRRKTRRRRLREGGGGREGYKRYLFRVLKQVHPGMGISSQAMTVLNSMMSDMFERLAGEAARLLRYAGRKTMTSREIQGAVKLVLPGELGRHAVSEGIKAVCSYMPCHK